MHISTINEIPVVFLIQTMMEYLEPVAKDKLKHINDIFDKSIKSIDKLIKSMNSNDTSIFNFNIELKDILNNPPFFQPITFASEL